MLFAEESTINRKRFPSLSQKSSIALLESELLLAYEALNHRANFDRHITLAADLMVAWQLKRR